ncbi:oxidase assembly protein COX19 [Seminavis robusta]|uniref:Oxidase assembly protein COX19 n=1 Tax=Seminavis robusta TaxID=568900 RepID=A0A9N8HT19_9STRA|nr:oxidase assembly protein COX19 [Seminavis robusta]|eukprot:Sro1455_g274150.1 oxidase assembly protein COX19 (122) ;mRNA; f:15099-15739
MASMSFSSGKQVVRPPQRGIFPLDHYAECKPLVQKYLNCLKESQDVHHKCKEFSKDYLQCRMDKQLMATENLDNLGFSPEAKVEGAKECDKSKEKNGFVAGKHIDKGSKWWFQKSKKDWSA